MIIKKYRLRAYNLTLFIKAVLSILRLGKRGKVPPYPKKILVIQLAKLGDMVCITPVLHALRKHRPDAKIYVLGDSLNKLLLENNPDVDEYIIFNKNNLHETISYLKHEQIEVACLRGTAFIGLIVALLSGIPSIIATRIVEGRGFETRTYKWLLPFVCTIDFKLGEYMPRQFLRLLEPIGIIENDTKKHLGFSKAAANRVTQFFLEKNIDIRKTFVVGVSPTAGSKIKEWPEERFVQIINHITSKHKATVLLIGGPTDAKKLIRVTQSVATPSVINTQGLFNMDETKALIAHLNLFISVDTGPIYIAEAFGVPTVDIVGPVDVREQPPQGFLNRNIVPPGKAKPQLSILNARMYDKEIVMEQILSITTTQVSKEIDQLIQDIRSRATS